MKRINTVAKDVVDSAFQVHTKLGLLINFGETLIKDGIFRIANGI